MTARVYSQWFHSLGRLSFSANTVHLRTLLRNVLLLTNYELIRKSSHSLSTKGMSNLSARVSSLTQDSWGMGDSYTFWAVRAVTCVCTRR